MADSGQLESKTAVITGGGSGIGRALCLGLAQEGAAIAVADIRLPEAQATVAEIQERGGSATAIQVDVAESTSVDAMVQAALEISGRVDVLINCAGIYPRHSVVEMSPEEWRHVLEVNLTGTFLCCKAAAGPMMAQGKGKMVNLVSGRGVTGAMNGAHYAASKGGLIAFTASLGMELGPHGINVNAVAPGATDTPMLRGASGGLPRQELPDTPVTKRMGQPEDLVGPVLFLAGDASNAMYGQVLFLKTP
jgi:3-oxoacyl-[acyl-carrier protein] reductase